jgi:DNA polymerase-3 subunit epsilon
VSWLGDFFERRRSGAQDATQARWVVVDCETSGLDVASDRLLAIGALAVRAGRIDFDDSYSALLRQAAPSDAANILIHGIGGEAQTTGTDPAAAVAAFVAWADAGPLVAFHAHFDRAMLERAARASGARWRGQWLDVAELAAVLFVERARECRSLDDWLAAFSIPIASRHDALGDAYATAQLFQIALSEARKHGFDTVGELLAAGKASRWISR